MWKKNGIYKILTIVLAGLCIAGCQDGKDRNNEKTAVTMLYYTELQCFEELVEETYPDIDFQFERSQSSTYNSDNLRRLRNGHGKDLVFTSIPNGEISEYMLDLSANDFTTRFADATMEMVRKEGKTIYLPMPNVYQGIIVNKTLVESLGKNIPKTSQEFFDILETAKKSKVGVDGEGFCFASADVDGLLIGEMIMSAAVPDFLGIMEGERWTKSFIDKEAKAQGVLNNQLHFFITMTEKGYMDSGRMNVENIVKDAVHTDEEMSERNLLACYGSSILLKEIRGRNQKDEFVMIPFLSEKGNEPWISTKPMAYLGVNGDVEKDEKKLDAVLRVMELFSTVEGQQAILKDTGADTSYLAEKLESSDSKDENMDSRVQSGYVYNMDRFDSDFLWLIGKNISEVCQKSMTMEEAMESLDRWNQGKLLSQTDNYTLIGTVKEDLLYENYNTRKEETAIGNFITDVIRDLTNADMAFVNGGSIRASLYQGDVYISDVAEVCPYGNNIVVLEVSGQVVYDMLANGISDVFYKGTPGGRFLQVSGLSYTYSVKPDTEVYKEGQEVPMETSLDSVVSSDGKPLDKEKKYRIAVTDYMCGYSGYEAAGDGYTMLNVFDEKIPKGQDVSLVEIKEETFEEALIQYFEDHSKEVINAQCEGRIVVKEAK